jgi:hypothetical protein
MPYTACYLTETGDTGWLCLSASAGTLPLRKPFLNFNLPADATCPLLTWIRHKECLIKHQSLTKSYLCFRLSPFYHEQALFCQGLNLSVRFAFRYIPNCNLNHAVNVCIYSTLQTSTNSLILDCRGMAQPFDIFRTIFPTHLIILNLITFRSRQSL